MQTDELRRQAEYAQRLEAVRLEREAAAREAAAQAEARRAANTAARAAHRAEVQAEHAAGQAALAARQEARLQARALSAWTRGGGSEADFADAWPRLKEAAVVAAAAAELTSSTPRRALRL
jgi:colicin import membrane protein